MPRRVSWAEVYQRLVQAPPGRLYGVPRGGSIVAGLTGRAVDHIEDADWIVEDIIDTGTSAAWLGSDKPVWGLFDRARDGSADRDLVFPWESGAGGTRHRRARLERLGSELLETLGYDPGEEHLRQTPRRWADWWEEATDPGSGPNDTTFEVVTAGQMVVVSGLHVWSICEHHLLPFSANVAIGYLPEGRVLGLSKFARITTAAGRRLQLQERMTREVADEIVRSTGSEDVAVLVRGRHLCVEARGVRTPALATSLVTAGRFQADPGLRNEFLLLATNAQSGEGAETLVP